jgi:hypothetical protein
MRSWGQLTDDEQKAALDYITDEISSAATRVVEERSKSWTHEDWISHGAASTGRWRKEVTNRERGRVYWELVDREIKDLGLDEDRIRQLAERSLYRELDDLVFDLPTGQTWGFNSTWPIWIAQAAGEVQCTSCWGSGKREMRRESTPAGGWEWRKLEPPEVCDGCGGLGALPKY